MKMSISEIREASYKRLMAERAQSASVRETTPATATQEIVGFCQTLGGSSDPLYVDVVNDAQGMYGWCSDGVCEKVIEGGGRIVFGWAIWEWPGVIVTSEFHAVWESPDRVLLDITPKPWQESRILFVPDYTYPEGFDFDLRPRNRRLSLYKSPERTIEARQMIASFSASKLAYEQRRADKAGKTLEDVVAAKLSIDEKGLLIENFILACNQHEEYFDHLGGVGYIQADKKFFELMQKRVHLQELVQRSFR